MDTRESNGEDRESEIVDMDTSRYRILPGTEVRLSDFDSSDKSLFEGTKEDRQAYLVPLNRQLEQLQELLYAEHKHKVLVVLQAPDTGGKDGTIRHVFESTNPQGVNVVSFKSPTQLEQDHDFLWRCHARCPASGEIVIFNRSHYEDVLIARVRNLVPEECWKKRYANIVNFERMLHDEGTLILKFFLHISKEEQRDRLLARRDDPHKRWKLTRADVAERAHWEAYQSAFEDMLSKTSIEVAPWYVIPANSKSYRNILISKILIEALRGLDMSYPEAEEDLSDLEIE